MEKIKDSKENEANILPESKEDLEQTTKKTTEGSSKETSEETSKKVVESEETLHSEHQTVTPTDSVEEAPEIKFEAATKKESEENPQTEVVEESPKATSLDGRTIGIAVLVLIGIFATILIAWNLSDNLSDLVAGAATVDVDAKVAELQAANRAGTLSADEGVIYDDFSFVYYDGLWWSEVYVQYTDPPTKLVIPLHYNPIQLEDVKVSGSLDPEFDEGTDVYVVIDPTISDKHYTLALSEISFNIVKGVNRKPVAACSSENTVCEGREILTCDNNPEGYPLVQLVIDENETEGKVEYDGTCMIVTGSSENLVKASERLLLAWYQVM